MICDTLPPWAERVAIASRPAHCAASNSERAVRGRAVRAAGVAGWLDRPAPRGGPRWIQHVQHASNTQNRKLVVGTRLAWRLRDNRIAARRRDESVFRLCCNRTYACRDRPSFIHTIYIVHTQSRVCGSTAQRVHVG